MKRQEETLAAQKANAGYEAALRAREAELERARCDVERARRRFEAFDPTHWHVRAYLETEFEQALKRFNRKVQQDGVLSEARRRARYESPQARRKRKAAAQRRKQRRIRQPG